MTLHDPDLIRTLLAASEQLQIAHAMTRDVLMRARLHEVGMDVARLISAVADPQVKS